MLAGVSIDTFGPTETIIRPTFRENPMYPTRIVDVTTRRYRVGAVAARLQVGAANATRLDRETCAATTRHVAKHSQPETRIAIELVHI